jgi:hypothetical protein
MNDPSVEPAESSSKTTIPRGDPEDLTHHDIVDQVKETRRMVNRLSWRWLIAYLVVAVWLVMSSLLIWSVINNANKDRIAAAKRAEAQRCLIAMQAQQEQGSTYRAFAVLGSFSAHNATTPAAAQQGQAFEAQMLAKAHEVESEPIPGCPS